MEDASYDSVFLRQWFTYLPAPIGLRKESCVFIVEFLERLACMFIVCLFVHDSAIIRMQFLARCQVYLERQLFSVANASLEVIDTGMLLKDSSGGAMTPANSTQCIKNELMFFPSSIVSTAACRPFPGRICCQP